MTSSLTADAVQSCIAWLDYASDVLNPLKIPHHSIGVQDMHAFMQAAPPPPPALQEQWSTQVWSLPGEPYEVYLLRCLAHQSGRTLFTPHYSLDPAAHDTLSLSLATEAPQTPQNVAHAALTLFHERCVVVGLRVEPAAQNLLQTGWDVQPCLYCIDDITTTTSAASQRHNVLPLMYGGDTCDRCGRSLPLLPAWTRMTYLVVQRSDRTRTAAVAYGDGALRSLPLGSSVRALLYLSQTEQQQPMLVVHAAQPDVPSLLPQPVQPAAPMHGDEGCFRLFYDEMQAHQSAQRWMLGTAHSLDDVACAVSPRLLGQRRAKGLILLVVLHTLYCAQRCPADVPRHPLHLLLLGPAKTGKSALLRAVQKLMGLHADVLDSTVVRSQGGRGEEKKSVDGASFLSALPSRHRDLLMAGPGMTTTTLILDHLPAAATASSLAPLKDVLERQRGCIAAHDSGDGTASVRVPVHIIAAAEEETASAALLAPFFVLVASLTPTSTLGDSALISQDVVAASRARASCSRSASRGTSASSSGRSSPSHSQRANSQPRYPSRADASSAPPVQLTADDVQYLLRRTADPPLLHAVMSRAVCYASYMPKLIAAAALVEDAQPPPCAVLPPPSTCRGSHVAAAQCAGAETGEQFSASSLCLHHHLRALRCLSMARLMLETADDVRAAGWTAPMRDEVWQLYEHHLVTLADFLHHRSSGQRVESARVSAPQPPALSGYAAAIGAAWPNGRISRGGSTKKVSKKKCRLFFVEELRRCQSRSTLAERVAVHVEAERLFAQMGGSTAFGDPFDTVMAQLQGEGLILRRHAGWRVL